MHTRGNLFSDGPSRYHALTVRPQSEGKVRTWLGDRDVFAFYPVTETSRFRNGRDYTHEQRFIPGYVFAHFNGTPRWHLLTWEHPWITGVIRRHDGEPGWLTEDSIAGLKAMRSTAELLSDKRRQARTIRKGDRVRIKGGYYEGNEVEIIELRMAHGRERGVFRIGLLGTHEVEMEISRMEKVA
jgi:transcription antitermination factor NusG